MLLEFSQKLLILTQLSAIIGTRTCAVYQYNKIVVGIFGLLGAFIVVVAVVSGPAGPIPSHIR